MSMSRKKPQPVPPAATRWAEQTHLGVAQGGQRAFPRGRRQLKSKGFSVRLIGFGFQLRHVQELTVGE